MMKVFLKVSACIFCASFAMGCGPQEKPAELVELEEMRNSEESADINGAAPEAYKACTDLTNRALSAWQDGEQAQARNYAALGKRQYATAQAQAKRNDALARESRANQEIASLTLKMDTLKAKQDGLEKSIALIRASISDSDLASIEKRIQLAMTEREKAVGVEAPVTQKEAFEAAEAKLKLAGEYHTAGDSAQAGAVAEEARQLYAKAYEEAKPAYDKKMVSAQSAERQKALFQEAQGIVGPDYVFTDMKSVVIVVAAAFEKKKSDILPVKLDVFKRIGALANQYGDAVISIEGYTQKGTGNAFEVSQRRCDGVRDYLISQGVDYKRIMTTGKGKENLRYDEKKKDNRAKNDRVEVILTLP